MNKYLNMLLQVQELETILKENDMLNSQDKRGQNVVSELKNDIAGLKSEIPFEIVSSFERLLQKYGVAVCPMLKSKCTGCSMKLPVGIANNVLSDKNCIFCPNCGRYLFPDEEYEGKTESENKQYKGIARFSSLDLMFPRLEAETKEEAIKIIAQKTFESGFVQDAKDFSEALLKREKLISTNMGSGISFPHARRVKACGLTLAVGTLAKPIVENGFEEPLRILFVSAVPIYSSMFYLELVSKLANYFANEKNKSKLLKAKTAEDIWKMIVLIGR